MVKYKANTYSQFGEDGIIAECLRRINPSLKVAVEFGGHNGTFCSNTALLRDQGWVVYMYDLQATPPHVQEKRITPENVNELPECSLLSIDCDGPDYGIWEAYRGQPDIVIIEVNSSKQPTAMTPVNDMQDGTAFLPMKLLGEKKGYFMVCHTGNIIFAHNKHKGRFPDADETFNTSHL